MTYKVPKQTIAVAHLSVSKPNQSLVWTVPDHWQEQPKTEFRLASYRVPDRLKSVSFADFSVVSFPGDAGGLLANVNRWRRQMQLSSITVDRLGELLVSVAHPFLSITFLELHRDVHQDDVNTMESMYVGFFMTDDQAYFFKLTGSKSILTEHYEAFIAILKSVRYESL